MNVPNHEKKPFREMTAEERSAIVEAHIVGMTDIVTNDVWMHADKNSLLPSYAYRTRPRQLIIPWEVIKPEYKWAAMDEDRAIVVYDIKPDISYAMWMCGNGGNGNSADLSALNIDTTGIDWRESLVQRPDGV